MNIKSFRLKRENFLNMINNGQVCLSQPIYSFCQMNKSDKPFQLSYKLRKLFFKRAILLFQNLHLKMHLLSCLKYSHNCWKYFGKIFYSFIISIILLEVYFPQLIKFEAFEFGFSILDFTIRSDLFYYLSDLFRQ